MNREADEIYGENMKITMFPEHPDAKSPRRAYIRFLMDGTTGNMIHTLVLGCVQQLPVL
jgi:hypothetical protein